MLGQDTFQAVANLRLAPALAGLSLALFPFDPASHIPTYWEDSSYKPIKTTATA